MHRYTLSYFVDSIVVLLLFACLLYSHEYDKCGRVRRITHDCDKVEEQTYSYYSSGRLQEAVNEHARVSFRYEGMGLSVEERCDEHLIKRSSDKHGLIVPLRSTLSSPIRWVICTTIPAGSYATRFDAGRITKEDAVSYLKSLQKTAEKKAEKRKN